MSVENSAGTCYWRADYPCNGLMSLLYLEPPQSVAVAMLP